MIKIKSIHIENFRGIKELTLPINCNNFGIYGPNGTGKSGVVDALEFGLTGNITRLTGQGTGELNVTKHGPHIEEKDHPEKAKVVLEIYIPSLNKTASITRTVKNCNKIDITPPNKEIEAIVRNYAEHPEFALSRREILKYILTPPTQRAEQAQALLKLETLRKIQTSLKKIESACARDIERIYLPEEINTKNELMQCLGIKELNRENILTEVNIKRGVLNLPPILEFTKDTVFNIGLDAKLQIPQPQINKKILTQQITLLEELLIELKTDKFKQVVTDQIGSLQTLENNLTLLNSIKKEVFLKTGFELIDEAICPLCEVEWDISKLKDHLNKKLQEVEVAKSFKMQFDGNNRIIHNIIIKLIDSLNNLVVGLSQLDSSINISEITDWIKNLRSLSADLNYLEKHSEVKKMLIDNWHLPGESVTTKLVHLKEKINQTTPANTEGEAIVFLTLAQEKFSKYQSARRKLADWQSKHETAKKILNIYNECYESSLKKIYDSIQCDFAKYYSIINSDDEDKFSAIIASSPGKLDLTVDFYNLGFYPPNAYHSEGHQDGMGLCLYLALMKHISGNNFTFCVLDDVLMSVDIGHRKEVCKLLKNEFPNTQFVFTTHDEIWLRHMIAEALIAKKSAIRFLNWSVKYGPQYLTHLDTWEEVIKEIENGNTSSAAHKLRRLLEYIFYDLAIRLRAKVEMRENNSYDLGELYDATLFAWGSILDKAKKSANSWDDSEKVKMIESLTDSKKIFTQKVNRDKWLLNPLVHYNPWANFDSSELRHVMDVFKDLIECFKCTKCDSFIYVTPIKGEIELVRCDCNMINHNLKCR